MDDITTELYTPTVEEGQTRYFFPQSEEEISKISVISRDIADLVNDTRKELKIVDILPINLNTHQAEELRQAIKSQNAWKEYFHQLMDISNIPKEARNETVINLPWWNAPLSHISEERYQEGSLSLDLSIAHSYITQLIRYGKIDISLNIGKPISLSNNLITSDNFLILGWRGGHNLRDTIMSVPAGAVEYHSGKDPIFESLYAELKEEVGLTKKDVVSAELIGKLSNGMVKNNPHYVTRVRTSLSLSDVLKLWGASEDYREHKHILAYPNDFSFISNRIKDNMYDESKVDPDVPSRTTPANIGTILPHCAATILAHYNNP